MGGGDKEAEGAYSEALVKAACGGNRRAFGELFHILHPRIHRTVWGMMGSESEADEVAQEAFIKAWENRAKFNFQSRYSTWLHRIAVNCALDALRKRRRWRDRFVNLFSMDGGRHGGRPSNTTDDGRHGGRPSRNFTGQVEGTTSVSSVESAHASDRSASQDPLSVTLSSELREVIEQAVAELPEEQRTVLVLREYEGYSYAEIATTLKIQPGTVMSRLYHARQKLQTSLTKELS